MDDQSRSDQSRSDQSESDTAQRIEALQRAVTDGWAIRVPAPDEWIGIGPKKDGAQLVAYADDEESLRGALRRVGALPVARPMPRESVGSVGHRASVALGATKTERTMASAAREAVQAVRQARDQGYTGIPCGNCGSLRTVRGGNCLRCEECGDAGECG